MFSASYPVYVGTWTNWSRGPILGATLTLKQRDGALLVAFVALFVTFVGTCFWRIACSIFYQACCNKTPQDGVYHQRQAILRNAGSALGGFLSLLQVLWRWKGSARRPYYRILPLLACTALLVLGFAVASVFSSRISSLTGNEVLLSSNLCGIPTDDNSTVDDILKDYVPYIAQRLTSSMGYAANCYRAVPNAVGSDCDLFVKDRLGGSVVSRNANCPFEPGVCLSKDNNIMLDTGYVNLASDLGLNLPASDSLLWRRVVHCAPLTIENHTDTTQFEDAETGMTLNYTRYYYGQNGRTDGRMVRNYTYMAPQQGPKKSAYDSGRSKIGEYNLRSYLALVKNGSVTGESGGSFLPSQDIQRHDADVLLIFLNADSVSYVDQVDDYWYAAHRRLGRLTGYRGNSTGASYMADNPGSPLGCAAQYQVCYTEGKQCSPLGGILDSTIPIPTETERQANLRWWISIQLYKYNFYEILGALGAASLTSRDTLFRGIQIALPDDQWKNDVERWHNITLAALQASVVDSATGPTNYDMLKSKTWMTPSDENMGYFGTELSAAGKSVCRSQKIRSADYANFSILGLTITFSIGGLVILLNYTLQPLLVYIQKRCGSDSNPQYKWLEWYSNGTLQLQRLAHEEVGLGDWTHCDGEVPKTESNTPLAMLDIEDPKHPRLVDPRSAVTSIRGDAAENGSQAAHMHNSATNIMEIKPFQEEQSVETSGAIDQQYQGETHGRADPRASVIGRWHTTSQNQWGAEPEAISLLQMENGRLVPERSNYTMR